MSAGKVIFLLRAACAIALSKHADQPAANSCSGLVPIRAEPGVESLMSRQPSELREAPFSRPPVVWVLAVCRIFAIWLICVPSSIRRLKNELAGSKDGEQTCPRLRPSACGDVHNSLGEGLRRFLRQVVSYAARNGPMLVLARKLLGVRTRIRAWCAIGIALKSDGGHRDDREFGEPLLQGVVL